MAISIMNIDRHNYEEFFILYLDNELTAEQRRQVEDFAAANPDLKEELDMLLQSTFTPDTDIVFTGKADLIRPEPGALNIANYEKQLLLYVDNELTASERKDLESWINTQPEAQKELLLLQRTKLEQDANIIFPDKKSLYRYEQPERRIMAARWWRMSAAAVLLLGVSTAAFMFNREKQTRMAARMEDTVKAMAATSNQSSTSPAIAKLDAGNPGGEQALVPQVKEDNAAPLSGAAIKHPVSTQRDIKPAGSNANEKAGAADNFNSTNSDISDHQNNPVAQRTDVINKVGDAFSPASPDLLPTGTAALTLSKEIDPLPAVTSAADPSLDKENGANDNSEIDVAQSGKKNRFRGFFRKVTRTFEKNTNIKATDGDDRLLVGGLAIKL